MVKLPSSVGMKGEAPLKTDEALVRRLAWQAGLNGDTGLDEKKRYAEEIDKVMKKATEL